MKVHTHYDNLKVAEDASLETIRAAYRRLIQKWHPDRHPHDRANAERITVMLNQAYVVLSDPVQRKEHDAWIRRERAKQADMATLPPPVTPPDAPQSSPIPEAAGNGDGHSEQDSLWEKVRRVILRGWIIAIPVTPIVQAFEKQLGRAGCLCLLLACFAVPVWEEMRPERTGGELSAAISNLLYLATFTVIIGLLLVSGKGIVHGG